MESRKVPISSKVSNIPHKRVGLGKKRPTAVLRRPKHHSNGCNFLNAKVCLAPTLFHLTVTLNVFPDFSLVCRHRCTHAPNSKRKRSPISASFNTSTPISGTDNPNVLTRERIEDDTARGSSATPYGPTSKSPKSQSASASPTTQPGAVNSPHSPTSMDDHHQKYPEQRPNHLLC